MCWALIRRAVRDGVRDGVRDAGKEAPTHSHGYFENAPTTHEDLPPAP